MIASTPATAAGLRAVGISIDLDTQALAQGLMESTLWWSLGWRAEEEHFSLWEREAA